MSQKGRSNQEQPGTTRNIQEQPGASQENSQEQPGAARSRQEQPELPGAAGRSNQEQPGTARSSQEQAGAARNNSQETAPRIIELLTGAVRTAGSQKSKIATLRKPNENLVQRNDFNYF